jgi:glycosyltransferase involved in cell wall biosynthesis
LKEPLVSVIIPTFNRAPVICRAVESVLAQTYTNYELIIVDDGSHDCTSQIISPYEKRVRLIVQENRGVASARNTGIRNSGGELLAFLDSDDEWLPGKLERQISLYQGQKDFICHTNEIWIRDGNTMPQQEKHRKQGGRFFCRALERCLISPSAVVMARSLLDTVGLFDEDLPAAEDYDLWLRITAFHQVDFCPEPLLIKYGGHADQLSFITPAIDRFRIRAIEKILEKPDISLLYRDAAVKELARKCTVVALGCKKRGKISEANHYRELAESYLRNTSPDQ